MSPFSDLYVKNGEECVDDSLDRAGLGGPVTLFLLLLLLDHHHLHLILIILFLALFPLLLLLLFLLPILVFLLLLPLHREQVATASMETAQLLANSVR